jgi:hypothetical protein
MLETFACVAECACLEGGLFLSTQAYAAARFSESVLRGLEGEPDVYEAAYVESTVTELPYFASKVRLGLPWRIQSCISPVETDCMCIQNHACEDAGAARFR